MKSVIVVFVLAFSCIGCGSKKRVAYNSTPEMEINKERPSADKHPVGNNKNVYILPEDTGKFIKFPIASINEYINTFSEIAKFEMKAYGIPASITLAQGIVESGFGRGALTTRTNNHFGIKCHTGWQGEFDFHDDDEKGECFRKYNHPMYSFRDHSIFISSRSRYASLFNLKKDDYKGWARGLRAAGYATDKRYPQKLISFIEQYKLYEFDREVLEEGFYREQKTETRDYIVHIVEKGDTLYSISRKYFIPIEHISEVNNLRNTTLSVGQELKIISENFNN